MSVPHTAALDALAEQRAWARGALVYLMLAAQQVVYRAFLVCAYPTLVVLCSRRWGKTRFACVLAWMQALAHPGSIVRYACPTKAHGRQFVRPAMKWLSDMAPAQLRPRFVTQDNTWIWPNGSVMHLGSCESDADVDAQVGTECHLALIDEAGKIRSALLRKLHLSILLPQLLTYDLIKATRDKPGRVLVLGTPSDTPDHYLRHLVMQAEIRGTLIRHTVDDCTHLDADALRELMDEVGGRESDEAQRELFCQFVTSSSRALIPAWRAHAKIVAPDEWTIERPRYFDAYTVADTGFNDLTVVGFGYYHFELDCLVIEDEIVMRNSSGGAVGRAVLVKERELWGEQRPHRRWADASPQTLADLRDGSAKRDAEGNVLEDGVVFSMAEKQDSVAALNRLQTAVERERIRIHPRCKTTIAHLEHGIWNENRSDFERVEDPDGHHFDGVAMMKYAVRACQWGKNPAPRFEPLDHQRHGISPARYAEYSREQALKRGQGDAFVSAFRSKGTRR